MPDQRALKILFHRYWSSEGWTNRPISDEEFEYARQAGVMFHDVAWTHDEIIQRIRTAVAQLSPAQVGRQFVASLSSRRLDLRSALGSYAVGRLMPDHTYSGTGRCPICGELAGLRWVDRNVLSFERYKWGGVRHLDPEYIAFDLQCFMAADHLEPRAEDWFILAAILSTIRALPRRSTPNDAARALTRIVRSNDSERRCLLEILGYCSVLETPEQPGFWRRFVPHAERPPCPPGSRNDWSYPIAWWRGDWGVNDEAVRFFFPSLQESG